MYKLIALSFVSMAQASHLDDLEALDNFKWDRVAFKTKKDCALDAYPEVSQHSLIYPHR